MVDYLNLELRIVHQDIAPRNILVDREPSSSADEKIRLFDFDNGARVGLSGCIPTRNDVKGVVFTLYEIVTLDYSYRKVPHDKQDPDTILNLEEWPVERSLDNDLAAFREHLNAWVKQRKAIQGTVSNNHDASLVDIPELSEPSPVIMSIDKDGKPVYKRSVLQKKKDALKFGNRLIAWERAPDNDY